MATTTMTKVSAKMNRLHELKTMLEDRRCELAHKIHGKIRNARTETKDGGVLDQGENSELDIQEEIEFALIQMKADTLNQIDAALHRLEEGTYGDCFECGNEIPKARLQALPFATRCKRCEENRETVEHRDRMIAQHRGFSAGWLASSPVAAEMLKSDD
jgi:DnaK suppressor protein